VRAISGWIRVGDVLGDARREQDRLLQNDRELGTQVGDPILAQIDSIKLYRSEGRVVEAREKIHERRLARPRGSGDTHPRVGLEPERDGPEDRVRSVVG